MTVGNKQKGTIFKYPFFFAVFARLVISDNFLHIVRLLKQGNKSNLVLTTDK